MLLCRGNGEQIPPNIRFVVMKFTIVYCYRDRDIERVRRSVQSLLRQKSQNFQIIFIDYGSTPDYRDMVEAFLLPIEQVAYHYIDTTGHLWNRAHALNIGIRLAQTQFVFTADIDQLFHAEFTGLLEGLSKQHEVCYLNTFLLPPDFDYKSSPYKQQGFDKTNERGRGLSLIKKEVLAEHGAYSEIFSIWGYEDNELHERLERRGLDSVYVDNNYLFHQWHPRVETTHSTFPQNWRSFMRDLHSHPDSDIQTFFPGRSWGEVLAQRLDQQNPAIDIVLEGTSQYLNYKLANSWGLLTSEQVMKACFVESTYLEYKATTTYKFGKSLTRIFQKFGLNIHVEPVFQNRNLSIYDVRDIAIYFLYNQRVAVADYYLKIDDERRSVLFWIQKK